MITAPGKPVENIVLRSQREQLGEKDKKYSLYIEPSFLIRFKAYNHVVLVL